MFMKVRGAHLFEAPLKFEIGYIVFDQNLCIYSIQFLNFLVNHRGKIYPVFNSITQVMHFTLQCGSEHLKYMLVSYESSIREFRCKIKTLLTYTSFSFEILVIFNPIWDFKNKELYKYKGILLIALQHSFKVCTTYRKRLLYYI